MTLVDEALSRVNRRLLRARMRTVTTPGYIRQRAATVVRNDWRAQLDDALAPLAADLEVVEQVIAANCARAHPALRDATGHICAASGKALRPAVALWASRIGPLEPVGIHKAAAAMELLHVATLHHDDVIDDADTRRGVSSVNAQWGNTIAILSGDYLIAVASKFAAEIDEERASRSGDARQPARAAFGQFVAQTLLELVDGEVAELDRLYDIRRTEAEYLASIRGKTAALFRASAFAGAMCGGADRRTTEMLIGFGQAFGMGFQIADDLLDISSSARELGKPACNDIRQGVYTLPVLAAARRAPQVARELERERPDYAKISEMVIDSGGYADAVEKARSYLDQATSLASSIRGDAAEALVEIAGSVLSRVVAPPTPSPAAQVEAVASVPPNGSGNGNGNGNGRQAERSPR